MWSALLQSLIGGLVSELGAAAVDQLIENIKSNKVAVSQPHEGALWISDLNGDRVLSAFYHPTKLHSATTYGKLGEKKSIAAAGKWAVSFQTKGLYGNKTNYNTM